MKTVHLAILGAGNIARKMARTAVLLSAAGNRDVTLFGVASRSLERAEAFAREFGAARVYGSYEEMLSDPEVDLVYVATPHSHHAQHVRMCLMAGKAVLCEKPLTANGRQAAELFALAREKGLLLCEAIWTRYLPSRGIIYDAVHSGRIGQPRTILCNFSQNIQSVPRIAEPALAGGGLLDLGVYNLNFAEMVFGHPQSMYAQCIKTEKGVDDIMHVTLLWEDGRSACLTTCISACSDNNCRILGTEGYVVVDNVNNPMSVDIYDRAHHLIEHVDCPEQLTGFENELLEAAHAVREGRLECPSMPAAESMHVMEMMDHLRAQCGIHYPFE